MADLDRDRTNERFATIARLSALGERIEAGFNGQDFGDFPVYRLINSIAEGYNSGTILVGKLFNISDGLSRLLRDDSSSVLKQELLERKIGDLTSKGEVASQITDIIPKICNSEEMSNLINHANKVVNASAKIENIILSHTEEVLNGLLARTAEETAQTREFYGESGVDDLTSYVLLNGAVLEGHGGFADVYSASYVRPGCTARKVAIKVPRVFQNDLNDQANLIRIRRRHRREIKVWSGLHHVNIVPLLGLTHKFNQSPLPAMVSPFLDNGNLHAFLDARRQMLTLENRLHLLSDVIDGLSYLHLESVIHGDLTSTNILISHDFRAQLSDFGLSKIISDKSDHTSEVDGRISLQFCAPEMIRWTYDMDHNLQDMIQSTKMCDVYSFGCVTIQVITGKPPYSDSCVRGTIISSKLAKKPYPRPVGSSAILLTDNLWDFIEECWRDVPEERPEARQVQRKLRAIFQHFTAGELSGKIDVE